MRIWKDLPLTIAPALLRPALGLRAVGSRVLDVVFPPKSLLTGAPSHSRAIESELWGAVTFLDEPCCSACGFPFDYDQGIDALCGRCAARTPKYDAARAAFVYDDLTRKLVLDFKHGGQTAGLPVFTAHMLRAGRNLISQADYVIPVPLHRSRLLRRRYNQSALLARQICKASGAQFDPDILQRVKATQTQGGKTASGRRRNVMAAFAVREQAIARIAGKTLLLIDDVYTTGATLESCAACLKRAGAARVDALTLARVVKPADVPT